MRILIVEDDSSIAQTLELQLMAEGFNSHATDVGEEAISLASIYDYDAITLDLNLPDMSGLDVLRKLRAAKLATPVLVLSATSDASKRIEALNLGADDVMAKPWNREELIARLNAIMRRAQGHAEPLIVIGNLTVDTKSKLAFISGERVHLTCKEYQMLELLARRQGSTLSKEAFLNDLYGGMDEPELKIVDVFICKIRKKLARLNDGVSYIETVWGRGYVMRADATEPRKNQSLNSHRTFIIERILEAGRPLPRAEILEGAQVDLDRVSLAVNLLVQDGLVLNVGSTRRAEYEVTANGRAWLNQRGRVAA